MADRFDPTRMTDEVAIPPDEIREHLRKVLASDAFRGSRRSRALLAFVVERTLDGEADRLKEYTIGADALGRGDDFDPRVDPIVRAEASRLRRRLEQYYAADASASVRIVLPKGSYAPQFERPKPDATEVSPAREVSTRALWFAGGAAAGAVAAAIAATWALWRAEPQWPALHLDVELRSNGTLGSDVGTDVVLSPDAARAVFVARAADRRGRLNVFRLADGKVTELDGTEGARSPFVSADGLWAGFWADGAIKKVALDGGAPVEIMRSPDLFGASWSATGDIVAASGFGVLTRISSTGGEPSVVLDTSAEFLRLGWPQVLPDREHVLLTVTRVEGESTIELLSLSSGERRAIVHGGTHARHVAGPDADFIVYLNQGTLFVLPFDLRSLVANGAPRPVLDDVAYASSFGYGQFDVSANGVLVYRRDSGLRTVAWLDRAGGVERLPLPSARYTAPRLSPDGRQLLLPVIESGVGRFLLYDLTTGRATRLDLKEYGAPAWVPNGRSLVVGGTHGLSLVGMDAGLEAERLTSGGSAVPWSFTRDGARLAYHEAGEVSHFDLWTLPLRTADGRAAGRPEPYLRTSAIETWPTFSQDGRWIAHASNESGAFEVYVRAFPDDGSTVQVSRGGGRIPTWSPTDAELLYQTDDERIMVVEYEVVDGRFVTGAPRPWTTVRLAETGVLPAFDVAPDGESVIALLPSERPGDRALPNHVTFIFDFAQRLTQ